MSLLGIRKRPILAEIDYNPVAHVRIHHIIHLLAEDIPRMNRCDISKDRAAGWDNGR